MNEKEKREKAIKGLEMIRETRGCTDAYYMDCKSCAYNGEHRCIDSILADAIALLKAQEPRGMTLEEIQEGKPYWLEMRRITSEYAICKLNDNGDSAFLDFAVQYGDKTLESNGYGKTWRCWTSCPTDEQREAVPWN